jgi:membrane-associated phospholipid phosphatase
MQTHNNRLRKVSRAVSVLGHPLLTAAGFVLFVSFTRFGGTKALVSSGVVIGLVILPIIGWNYRNTQKGRYSNFDVSVRSQRHSFYRVSVGLLLLATGVLWLTDQPPALRYGMAFALLLVVLSALANLYVKVSLHTSVSVFLSLALLTIHPVAGTVLLGFSAVVAGSRLVLRRHTLPEIGAGAAIGLAVGGGLYFFMRHAAPMV